MSSLHDFVHHELGAMPGPVTPHSIPPVKGKKQKEHVPKGAVSANAKADTARLNGALKGDLYYTQQEAESTAEGWIESDQTVEHKLISKEMFPQG